MSIVHPEDMQFNDETFSMIIYGSPGIGKTTLALSAPAPVLMDFDHGSKRVKAYHRKETMSVKDYFEVLDDLESPEVKNAKTLIIDTGGSLVTYLQDWAKKVDPKTNCQKDGKTISIKGFGAVKAEFQRFTNYIRDVLHKNVIYVFHSDEQKGTDGNPIQRLQCEGAARNIVWQPCDFGGFVQMVGTTRTITFTPTEEFFAKGCFGISGTRTIPELTGPNVPNDFLTKLFAEAQANIAAENEYFAPLREQYEKVMAEASALISDIDSPEAANAAGAAIGKMEHSLTSYSEIKTMFREKIAELGYVFDRETKLYSERPVEQAPEAPAEAPAEPPAEAEQPAEPAKPAAPRKPTRRGTAKKGE